VISRSRAWTNNFDTSSKTCLLQDSQGNVFKGFINKEKTIITEQEEIIYTEAVMVKKEINHIK